MCYKQIKGAISIFWLADLEVQFHQEKDSSYHMRLNIRILNLLWLTYTGTASQNTAFSALPLPALKSRISPPVKNSQSLKRVSIESQ